MICASLLAGCGSDETAEHEMPAAGTERQSFVFMGTVESVDTVAHRLAVRNDDVPGWMAAMSMSYGVDRPEMLSQLTQGARVRATVYAGDFATLYDLELAPQ